MVGPSMRRGCGSWTPGMFRLLKPVLRLVILLVLSWLERVLADACTLAGGVLPMEGALRLGGGRLDACLVRLGGVQAGKIRSNRVDLGRQ